MMIELVLNFNYLQLVNVQHHTNYITNFLEVFSEQPSENFAILWRKAHIWRLMKQKIRDELLIVLLRYNSRTFSSQFNTADINIFTEYIKVKLINAS